MAKSSPGWIVGTSLQLDAVDRVAAEVPRARRLPDVPGAAHLLPLERPDVVNPSLLAFLP